MDTLASNYAQALFRLSDEYNRQDYAEALRAIQKELRENPDFYRLLCSYSLTPKEKEEVLAKVYGSSGLKHLLPFLYLLARNHRFEEFDDIEKEFHAMVNASSGIKDGIVYSAAPLTKEQLEAIETAFEKKLDCQVELRNIVDPRLLGGVKVALDEKVYDGSLLAQLEGLKKQLLQGGHSK